MGFTKTRSEMGLIEMNSNPITNGFTLYSSSRSIARAYEDWRWSVRLAAIDKDWSVKWREKAPNSMGYRRRCSAGCRIKTEATMRSVGFFSEGDGDLMQR